MPLRVFFDETPPLGANTYVVSDPASGDAVLIDPGDYSPAIAAHIASHRLRVHLVLNTHGHFDHIAGNDRAVAATGGALVCHALDAPMLSNPMLNGAIMFGMSGFRGRAPDRLVEDGETLMAGSLTIRAIHTPGHSPGGVCYLIGGDLFCGDTLFAGGIGRYDLPGGDGALLLRSIREKILALPDAARVHPGHGPATTIGAERADNPFLA